MKAMTRHRTHSIAFERADLIQAYEPRIAALERLVGEQALQLEFLKGAVRTRGHFPSDEIVPRVLV
jgi:hypothetical protein